MKADKKNSQVIEQPQNCPGCGAPLQKEDIYLRCVNSQCKAVRYEYLKFFVSKEAMDIEFFGPELVMRLYQNGSIKKISDVFTLTKEVLLQVERMGDKLADKIIDSIAKRKRISLSFFLKCLGIRNVGDHIAKVIAKAAETLENVLKLTKEDLIDIHEIGPGVAESVATYFQEKQSLSLLRELSEAGVLIEAEQVSNNTDSQIAGKTFVLTGSLEQVTRKEAQDFIEKKGGKVSGSVSKKTDFVIVGENAGSKLKKATELGLSVLSESEFIEMIGE